MSGIKVTRENPATPLPTALEAPGDVSGEDVDWPTGPDSPLPLDGLSDVDAPTPDDGDVLTWDDGAGEWVAAPGGGSVSLPWFDVTDYGAVGDNTTDDTVAVQAAIDACETAGGGIVFFPRGRYLIAGALQDTGRSNAQLLLPRINTSGGEQITIELRGEAAPTAIPYIAGASVDPDLGSIIRSSLAAGTGSVIGSWGPSGSSDDFTLLRAVLHNLVVRTIANPTISAVDLSHVEAAELRDVIIDAGEYTMSSISSQTTSTSFGLKLPANNNGASTYLDTVNVVGFYNSILAGEHTIGVNVATWASRVGLTFPFGNHASHFDRLGTYHCIVGITFTGAHYFNIDQWNIEHASSGTWVTVNDIDDGSNNGHGHLAWHVVLQGTGTDHTLTVNGATDIYRIEIGDDPFAGASFATPSITLSTSAAAGAASTVIRSDSTIAAFDATVPVTQAFGDTAATGSAAFAARRDHVHGMPASPTGSSSTDHFHIVDEQFSGDASTTVFYLANEAVPDSVMAYVSGTRTPVTLGGSLNDEITFGSAPASATLNISVDYAAATS